MNNKDIIDTELFGKLTFDPIYKDRMVKLRSLIKKAGIEMFRYKFPLCGEILLQNEACSFLGLSQMVSSQLFYLFMKDELSGAERNKLLKHLCEYISTDNDSNKLNDEEFKANFEYMKTLTCEIFNDVIEAGIYDFYMSMYAGFETAINAMSRKYEAEIREKLEASRIKHFKKLLKNKLFHKEVNIQASTIDLLIDENKRYILQEFPVYISLQDRINYLYSVIPLELYSHIIQRDHNKDKEFLLFAGAIRNTIHNNGVYNKEDREYDLRGYKYRLEKGKIAYHENLFDENFALVDELFDIYCAILRCFFVAQ